MEAQTTGLPSRNPNACVQCKLKKTRCNPSEVEGKCQKCLKAGTRCVPAEKHPRPRRVQRTSKTSGRVSELEKKLEGLIGSMEGRTPLTRADSTESPYRAEASIDPEEENGAEILIDIHKGIFPDHVRPDDQSDTDNESIQHSSPRMNAASMPTPASSSSHQNSSQTDQSFPDSRECEKLMSCFEEMLPYFPFIVIPSETNERPLSQEKPLLFLAMITAASFGYCARFQTILDKQFRQALSTKVIMRGEKSLEIIQGLLVYLAWYPYHLNPRKAQTSQFLHIAIGMCNDMGLDQPSQDSGRSSAEHRRAYLGCYYLSTTFSTIFKKPNNITYVEYTKTCCDTFLTAPSHSTDLLIPHLVNLCYSTYTFASSPLATTIPISTFQNDLNACLFNPTSISHPKTKELISLTLTFTHLFQTGFLVPHPASANRRFSPQHQPPSSAIIRDLKPCLRDCISYFDTLLSVSMKSYRSFTIIQWSQLICAVVILMTLSFPMTSFPEVDREWDSKGARREGRLGVYLESLCWRMSCLGRRGGGSRKGGGGDKGRRQGQGQNQFLLMGVVLEFVKKSFDRKIEKLDSSSDSNDKEKGKEVDRTSSNLDGFGMRRGESNGGRNGFSDAGAGTKKHQSFPKGLTKCPMLNGSLIALSTTPTTSTESPSSTTNIPVESPYDNNTSDTNDKDIPLESYYDLDDMSQWGFPTDELSLWDYMPDIDWNLGTDVDFTGL